MPTPIIEFVDIQRIFGEGDTATHVLRGVTLTINKGEFVSIMGPSGSGKSTLMHIMGFLDHASAGSYRFDGKDVVTLAEDERALMRRDKVGFVFQFFNLLPNSTVLDNILLPMMYARVPIKEREERARSALSSVGLSHRINHKSNQISGGERQRVAIARALVNNPSVLFADEPTGNLDTKSGQEVLGIFQKLHEEGKTIVMVTHESEAAEYAERIVQVRDGRILVDGNGHTRRVGAYNK